MGALPGLRPLDRVRADGAASRGAVAGRRARQRATPAGRLQAAVRPAGHGARARHRRGPAARLHVHDAVPHARRRPDRAGSASPARRQPDPVLLRRALSPHEGTVAMVRGPDLRLHQPTERGLDASRLGVADRAPGVPRRPRRRRRHRAGHARFALGGSSVPPVDLFTTLLTQRACRSFTADPVPDEAVERMLEAAMHAPSAENRQPWVFVVVRDAAVRAELTADRPPPMGQPEEGTTRDNQSAPRLFDEVDRSIVAGFGGAPVLIVVGGDTSSDVTRRALPSSIFPAVQNLLLAAAGLGFGSALTTLASHAPDEVRAAVGLPDDVEPMAIVPVGRPARPLGPPRRQPVRAKAHSERYGTPFPGSS